MKPLRENYHHELLELERELLALGKLCDTAVRRAVWALHHGAVGEARAIIHGDDAIDDAADELSQHAMRVIATQGPVAGDLRLIGAFIQASDELERIGDYAEGIAKLVVRHSGAFPVVPPEINTMAVAARAMLARALEALTTRDPSVNLQLKADDDAVDEAYDRLHAELTRQMQSDPTLVVPGTYLLWVGHNLERIGDRATNIGENVEYIVSGVKSERPK